MAQEHHSGGVQVTVEQKAKKPGEKDVKALIFRDFAGVNVQSPRQSIADNEFYWCENAQPIAPGNLPTVAAPSSALQTLTGETVNSAFAVNISGSNYHIAFCASGAAYQVAADSPYTNTTIGPAGTFSGSQVACAQWNNLGIVIIDPSKGYYDWNITTPATLTSIDAGTKGTTIESYSGRVWVGNGRSVKFTDVNAYNSFGGAGGSFTINDATLHSTIQSLFSANNFLYIGGVDSWDVLGNVSVSAGVTSFTRNNVTASIGTSQMSSVFPYYRSVMFANPAGFYGLAGATPQKLSDKLDQLVAKIDFTRPVSGAQGFINNILCAAFLFTFNDTFTGRATNRSMLALYWNNKWWFADQGTGLKFIVFTPQSGAETLFAWDTNNLYQLFSSASGDISSRIMTKLWDGGEPIMDKEVLKGIIGVTYGGSGGQTITATIDNEKNSKAINVAGATATVTWTNATGGTVQWQNGSSQNVNFTVTGYVFSAADANMGGGKYMGLTVTATKNNLTYNLFGTEYKSGARM